MIHGDHCQLCNKLACCRLTNYKLQGHSNLQATYKPGAGHCAISGAFCSVLDKISEAQIQFEFGRCNVQKARKLLLLQQGVKLAIDVGHASLCRCVGDAHACVA
eukprot:366512-Chlamydomonas_euryale.AAC.24